MPETAFVSPVASALVTLVLIAWMLSARDRLPLDVPNQRSLHVRPVPRSGGIAMMAGIFVGFAVMQTPLVVVLSVAALAAFSHFDDLRGLPIPLRFGAQLAAAAGFAYGALLGIGAWMSGDEALLIGCAIVAAAGAAFLLFNFPPARLFMGDAGSVPIGFLTAALSLAGWRDGDWPLWFPAVVFSPFIVDATLTLLKWAGAGERIWEAHNKHYYQRLVRMGWSHRRTALAEYALMLACGTTALWALREPPTLQLGALIGLVALHAALALWVDYAWRRRENKSIEP